jgi:hypothetical protein
MEQAVLTQMLAERNMSRVDIDKILASSDAELTPDVIAMICWRNVELGVFEYVGDGYFKLVVDLGQEV